MSHRAGADDGSRREKKKETRISLCTPVTLIIVPRTNNCTTTIPKFKEAKEKRRKKRLGAGECGFISADTGSGGSTECGEIANSYQRLG